MQLHPSALGMCCYESSDWGSCSQAVLHSNSSCCVTPSHRHIFKPLQGRLTVVLDMDGTLVSSYTPARAPRLPAGMLSYIVGRGARINPKGVFVVERPGLRDFFAKLTEFAGGSSELEDGAQQQQRRQEWRVPIGAWHLTRL